MESRSAVPQGYPIFYCVQMPNPDLADDAVPRGLKSLTRIAPADMA